MLSKLLKIIKKGIGYLWSSETDKSISSASTADDDVERGSGSLAENTETCDQKSIEQFASKELDDSIIDVLDTDNLPVRKNGVCYERHNSPSVVMLPRNGRMEYNVVASDVRVIPGRENGQIYRPVMNAMENLNAALEQLDMMIDLLDRDAAALNQLHDHNVGVQIESDRESIGYHSQTPEDRQSNHSGEVNEDLQ